MSNSLWPQGLQHTNFPCPSPSPRACSNSCPLSWWSHSTISSSVSHFSSCPQSYKVSGSFPVSRPFTSGSQSIGASLSVLPMSIQDWFPLGLSGLISLQSKGLSRVLSWWHMTKCRTSEQRATNPDVPQLFLNLPGFFTNQNLAKHFQNKPSAPAPAFSVGSPDLLSSFCLSCFHQRKCTFLRVTLSYQKVKESSLAWFQHNGSWFIQGEILIFLSLQSLSLKSAISQNQPWDFELMDGFSQPLHSRRFVLSFISG